MPIFNYAVRPIKGLLNVKRKKRALEKRIIKKKNWEKKVMKMHQIAGFFRQEFSW